MYHTWLETPPENITHKWAKRSALSQQAARNSEDSITKTNMKHNNKKDTQKKHHLGTVSKKILEGVNMLNGTNLTFNSDVDQDT